MGDTITAILPRPRPLPLGGRSYRAGELTLDQLADLQAYTDARWPDPLGGLRASLPGMEAEARRLALVAAHAEAEAGPPAWGWPESNEAHDHFVYTALRPHNRGFARHDAAFVVDHATAEEYLALHRVCRGTTPLDEIEGWLGLDRSGGGGGEPITWARAIVEVCEAYPAYTIESAGRLTVSQVRALRTGGKPQVRGVPVRPGTDLKTMVRNARAKFHGPDDRKGAG